VKSLNWNQRRKLKKYRKWFLLQLKEENIELGLEFYETRLNEYSSHLPKEIRVIYYYYRWLISGDDKHFQSIKALLIGASTSNDLLPSDSIQDSYVAKMLAVSFHSDTNTELKDTAYQQLAQTKNTTLKFAWILRQILDLESGLDEKKETSIEFKNLLAELPSSEGMSPSLASSYYKMQVHLLYYLKQYGELLKCLEAPLLQESLGKEFLTIKKASLYGDLRDKLMARQYSEAYNLLQELASHTDEAEFTRIYTHQLTEFFKTGSDIAFEWADHCMKHKAPVEIPGWEISLKYIKILASLRAKQFTKVRMDIDGLVSDLNSANEVILFSHTLDASDFCAYLLHLKALSFINETCDWQTLDKQNSEESENISVRNHSLWSQLLNELNPVIHDPLIQKSSLSWRNSILEGLILYLNSSAAISKDHIEKFRESIDHIENPETRQKLQGIHGELVIRSRATEEAISYINARDSEKLLELFRNVILPQGDAIPTLIRISAILTLWEYDRSFAALKYLKSIRRNEVIEQYLDLATEQVLTYEILKKLENECLSTSKIESSTLPALEPLSSVPDAKQMCELAIRVIHLKNGNWDFATKEIPKTDGEISDWIEHHWSYIQFYAAWQIRDFATITNLYRDDRIIAFLKTDLQRKACEINTIVYFIQDKKIEKANEILFRIEVTQKEITVRDRILSFCVWLLRHSHYQILIQFVEELRTKGKERDKMSGSDLLLFSLLEGLANSGLSQYNAADKIYQSIVEKPVHTNRNEKHPVIVGWTNILMIYQNIIGILNSDKDAKIGWAALKRKMEDLGQKDQPANILHLHMQLIVSLLLFIDDSRIADNAIFQNFPNVARELNLRPKTTFLEDLMQRVRLRNRLVADFWLANSRNNFELANNIFEKELIHIFKDNVPFPIQIVKVMIDWNLQKQDTVSLINQLNNIQNKYPEADGEFITKVRNYIKDGDKLKLLADLVRSNDYNGIIDFVEKTVWEGYKEGTQPVQVALAKLLAYQKLEKNEKAFRLGKGISQAEKLVQWAKDFGNLLLGYVYYHNNQYVDALKCFEAISRSKLNDHDINMYWAASHFAIGLQFLGKDIEGKEDEAFDSFARAMSKRGSNPKNIHLAPLFLHIGMLNLRARNGTKALASFQLASKTIAGLELNKNVTYIGSVALTGELVCKLMMNSVKLSDKDIHNSFKRFDLEEYKSPGITRIYQILVLLSHFMNAEEGKEKQVVDQIAITIKELDEVQPQLNNVDPVLLILKALNIIFFDKNTDNSEALMLFKQAKSIGVETTRLTEFLAAHFQKEQLKKEIFEIFALYLEDITTEDAVKHQLASNTPLKDYYRLNKGYTPDEIIIDKDKQKTSLQYMADRLKHIESKMENDFFKKDENKKLFKQLKEQLKAMKDSQEKFSDSESEILTRLIHETENKA